jgi:RNA polymerase sigma factor (sigma-70 family)
MLGGSRSDAEDVLQDVFLRAYGALRNDDRPVTLRAWLYRVAHNRCIDHLRRPVPPPAEVYELSRTPAHDPQAETVRREDLRRLVQDVQRLPEQQRSALLMRELDGLSYAELADALGTSVPAIKSLLVRARMGLVEAGEARDTACVEIRADLARAHGRGVRASGRSRRHLRDCDGCREYRQGIRGVREGLAALVPGGAGPLAAVAKLLGLGGASSGAAAGAGAGGSAAVVGGGAAATATATKVVAIVCCAAVVGGGAAEVREHVTAPAPTGHRSAHARRAAPRAVAVTPVKAPAARASDPARDAALTAPAAHRAARHERLTTAPAAASEPTSTGAVTSAPGGAVAPEEAQTGGAMAPDEDSLPDASGTGAAGAPSDDDPAATAAPTTPSAAVPATGATAPAPIDPGAPSAAGATGPAPTG